MMTMTNKMGILLGLLFSMCVMCGSNIKINTQECDECDDGNACTHDLCVEGGSCVNPPMTCDDNNPCTLDSCDQFKGCVNDNPLNHPDCYDGNPCTNDNCVLVHVFENGTWGFPDYSAWESTCVNVPNFAPCEDDGNPCTTDACNPDFLSCTHEPQWIPCSDDNPCTINDMCDGFGDCQSGTQLDCDDGNACTVDLCSPANACQYFVLSCDDGVDCTNDSCSPASGCVNLPQNVKCEDANPCTKNWCTGAGCQIHSNHGYPCDDGDACTTDDTCVSTTCWGKTKNCSDGNVCTLDMCNDGSCNHVGFPGLVCDDGNACTWADTCIGSTCRGLFKNLCMDGNPCTTDACIATLGCVHLHNKKPCSDGIACTLGDVCSKGSCQQGAPINFLCSDGNPCTAEGCNLIKGCIPLSPPTTCDDGDACTKDDFCFDASCMGGPPFACDDENTCTLDSCDSAEGCVHTQISDCSEDPCDTLNCDDTISCTLDSCLAGVCLHTEDDNACEDDGNPCTIELCDSLVGCVLELPTGNSCDDGNACSSKSKCFGGLCLKTVDTTCDDRDACTKDSCDTITGCVFTETNCNDGNACTTDFCSGDCQHTDLCAEEDLCVPDLPDTCQPCDPTTDESVAPGCTEAKPFCEEISDDDYTCSDCKNGTLCDDDDVCTSDDVCTGGKCTGTSLTCTDNNPCTTDSCNPATGCVFTNVPFGTPCDDANLCSLNDKCNASGKCLGGQGKVCADGDPCTFDACQPTTGNCMFPPNPDPSCQ